MATAALLASLLVLALFGRYLFLNWTSILETNIKGTDYSLISLQVFRAKSFEVLVGPYSRFSFNHPGPIQFYLYAVAEALPLNYLAAQALAQLCINALSFWLVVFFAVRIWGVEVASFLAISASAMVYLNLGFLSDTWGPSAIFLPYLLLLVSVQGVFHIPGALLVALVSSGWVLSNHIGLLVPLVLVFGVVLLVRKGRRLNQQEMVWGGAFLILCFLLPFYELFKNYPLNNMQRFFRFLSRYDPTVSYGDVFSVGISGFPTGGLGFVTLIAALLGLMVLKRTRSTGCILGAAFLGHIVSLGQTVGRLHPYLYWPCFTVLLVTGSLAFGPLISAVKIPRWTLPSVAAAILFVLGGTFQHDRGVTPAGYFEALKTVEGHPGSHFKLITKNHQNWEAMTAVADTLARRGVEFCVQSRLEFIFGRELVCSMGPVSERDVVVDFQKRQ